MPDPEDPYAAAAYRFRDDHMLSVDAAREAGHIAMRYFRREYETWDKGDNNPVTEADLAVDAHLHERLLSARPDYGWLSEETADNPERLSKDRVWVVDPIDGTRAFVKGRPHFTISIALVEAGRPISGVVYNPALDELYEASKENGAYLNGERIHTSDRHQIAGARMVGSADMFKHPRWPEPWPEMHVENRNSIAYRVVLVASGAFDGAVNMAWKHDWDLAAADLIIAEAGGAVTNHDGTPYIYNRSSARHRSMVAGGVAMHQALVRRLGAIVLS